MWQRQLGRILISIGVILAFRKVQGGNGFGGNFDNSLEILLTSTLFLGIGLVLFYKGKILNN